MKFNHNVHTENALTSNQNRSQRVRDPYKTGWCTKCSPNLCHDNIIDIEMPLSFTRGFTQTTERHICWGAWVLLLCFRFYCVEHTIFQSIHIEKLLYFMYIFHRTKHPSGLSVHPSPRVRSVSWHPFCVRSCNNNNNKYSNQTRITNGATLKIPTRALYMFAIHLFGVVRGYTAIILLCLLKNWTTDSDGADVAFRKITSKWFVLVGFGCGGEFLRWLFAADECKQLLVNYELWSTTVCSFDSNNGNIYSYVRNMIICSHFELDSHKYEIAFNWQNTFCVRSYLFMV